MRVMCWQPSKLWDPAVYSLHWHSIALADLSVDGADAAVDVSLVSGKVSVSPCLSLPHSL